MYFYIQFLFYRDLSVHRIGVFLRSRRKIESVLVFSMILILKQLQHIVIYMWKNYARLLNRVWISKFQVSVVLCKYKRLYLLVFLNSNIVPLLDVLSILLICVFAFFVTDQSFVYFKRNKLPTRIFVFYFQFFFRFCVVFYWLSELSDNQHGQ